jgi:antagonist of KipI
VDSIEIDHQTHPAWMSIMVKKGSLIKPVISEHGTWSYLALSRGFDTRPVLGSRSTYLLGAFGGIDGRLIQDGDQLPTGQIKMLEGILFQHAGCQIELKDRLHPSKIDTIHVLPDAQWSWFSDEEHHDLLNTTFKVTSQSNRMAYSLFHNDYFFKRKPEMLSEATRYGSIQFTPNGKLLVLLMDRQTIGGYPKMVSVAKWNLPEFVQLRPGIDSLKFELSDPDHAREALRKRCMILSKYKKDLDRLEESFYE